jgi:SPP1 gp7 family putative phage head morphogenesis protein
MHPHLVAEVRKGRDFARLVAGRRPVLRRKRLPAQRRPEHIQLQYFDALRQLLLFAKKLVDAQLVPRLPDIVRAAAIARGDSTRSDEEKDRPAEVNEIIERISREFSGRLNRVQLEQVAARYASATSAFQRQQLLQQLRAAVGVDVPLREGQLGAQLETWTARNVSLIKTVPQRYFAQVEAKVLDGVEQGRRWEEIARDLEERYSVAESTAKLIARDQVGKLYGGLNRFRQTELGIDRFGWETMNDNRVRDTHQHLQGRLYDWDDPPNPDTGEPAGDDGVIPGEEINCRCYARPDLTSVLQSLSSESDESADV